MKLIKHSRLASKISSQIAITSKSTAIECRPSRESPSAPVWTRQNRFGPNAGPRKMHICIPQIKEVGKFQMLLILSHNYFKEGET